jgi:hypothetical protein
MEKRSTPPPFLFFHSFTAFCNQFYPLIFFPFALGRVTLLLPNTENGSASKKMKLTNDKRKNTIFCYSSVQLPLAAFIDYIEKEYLNNFVNHCMESQQSKK